MKRRLGSLATSGTYAPRFFVAIEGVSAPDVNRNITEFSFTDNERAADELTLTLNNSGLRFQDDLRFFRGNRVKVRWGYPNDLSDTRQMLITEVKASYSSGVPVLILQGMDIQHAMNKGSKATNWGAVSSSDVAKAIAKRYRLGTVIPKDSGDARKEARLQTADVTDIQYLKGLADELHWDCFVQDGKLHFLAKGLNSRPLFEYTYFSDRSGTLISFDSELNLKRMPKTGVAAVNPQTGVAKEAVAATEADPYIGGYLIDQEYGSFELIGSAQAPNSTPVGNNARAAQDGAEALLASTPESSAAVTQQHANAAQARIELSAVEASMSVVGTPRLRARQLVTISGVGKAYSGNWRVTSATHTISAQGNVYSLNCTLKRNALNKGKAADKVVNPNNAPATDVSDKQPKTVTVELDTGAVGGFSP